MIEIVRTLPDGTVLGLTDDHVLMQGTSRLIGFDELTCATVVSGSTLARTFSLPDGTIHAKESRTRDEAATDEEWAALCEDIVPSKAFVETRDAEGNLVQLERLLTVYDWVTL